jgi:SAM-dependent methyltransferase
MFDAFADIYEAMIDWPKRLAHEGPFYRRWFERVGVQSVLDSACGSGRHAAMFHSWGLKVEGADLSSQMIDRARSNFGQPPGLGWAVRGFDQPIEPAKPFDAAVCVGNSLALAPDEPTVERAIQRMFDAVRDGGLIVIHVLNLWRLPDGPCVWQKCQRASISPQAEVLILKGVHRSGPRGYVEVIVADLTGAAPMRSESTPLLGIEAPELERMAERAGAKKIVFFGGYQDQPYLRQESVDLVMVAEK